MTTLPQSQQQPQNYLGFSSISFAYLVRFIMYNLVGALLPLGISFTIRQVASVQAQPGVYASELLFFGIMISATALGDITDESKKLGSDVLFQIIRGALLFGCIGVAAIFGVYQYDAIVGPGNQNFRLNITNLSIVTSSFLLITSLLAEILIARNKADLL